MRRDLWGRSRTWDCLSAAFATGWVSGSRCPFPSFSHCCRGLRKSCSPGVTGGCACSRAACSGQGRTAPEPGPCLHLLSSEAMPAATSRILHGGFPTPPAPICSPRGAPGEDRDASSPARPLKGTTAPSSELCVRRAEHCGNGLTNRERSDLSPGWAGSDLPGARAASFITTEAGAARSFAWKTGCVFESSEPLRMQGSPRAGMAAPGRHRDYPPGDGEAVLGQQPAQGGYWTCNRV